MKFQLTVNGTVFEKDDVPADKLLIDFLHEDCGLTGTKFSCGVGACGACKVALQASATAPMIPILACYARLKSVQGMLVTTVEGLGSRDNLHPLQQAFLEDHSFQCGFSTPGFLMAARVLMSDLERTPVHKDRLDEVILEAIGGNLCRCTGYVRYFKAIKRVILATPGLVLDGSTPPIASSNSVISFQISKKSRNDLQHEILTGRFEEPDGEIEFTGELEWGACRSAWISANPWRIRTGVRVRDLNLGMFFFKPIQPNDEELDTLRFELTSASEVDSRQPLAAAAWGVPVPVRFQGRLSFGSKWVSIQTTLLARLLSQSRMHLISQEPFIVDMRDLGFPLADFTQEFGLDLENNVKINLDVTLPYRIS